MCQQIIKSPFGTVIPKGAKVRTKTNPTLPKTIPAVKQLFAEHGPDLAVLLALLAFIGVAACN